MQDDRPMRLMKQAEQRMFAVTRTFNEMQSGPNPLTREEVARLVRKRPEMYWVLEKWT